MFKLTILIVFSILGIRGSDSARILCVFSYPSAIHQAVFRSLTQDLLQRGHELVVVTTDPFYLNGSPPNLKEVDVHDISYNMWRSVKTANTPNALEMAENLHKLFMLQFSSEQFQEIIREDNRFDLILLEESVPSNIVLSHFIKAPVVLISAFGSLYNQNLMGIPRQESLYPSILRKRIVDMSFWENINEIYNVYSFERTIKGFEEIQNAELKSFTQQEISMNELYNNVDVMMLNLFPIWAGIRPMPQSVVHLGGINIKPAEELPQDLQEYFNHSTHDIIYVNIGSTVPREKLQIMVDSLSHIPYDIIWKWDNGELPGKGLNIQSFKSVPQADVLRHPKVKIFITHGGHQSTDEAIAAGVPVIGVPFVGEQFFNSENFVRHNIGLKLDMPTLTEEKIISAVVRVMTDKGYHDNVVELRTLLRDQPQSTLTRASWWIDYVLKHGGAKHLRSPAANMPWTQYLEIELVSIAIFFLILLLFITAVLCYCLYKAVCTWYRRYTYRKMMNGMHYAR